MSRIIQFVQNLSLDITAGAMISCWFIGDFLGLEMPPGIIAGLGIAIWLIYTADHLLDARKATAGIVNPRHQFHRKYEKYILALVVLVFGLGVYNTFLLPVKTIYYGLILVGLSGLYFLYLKVSTNQRYKELFAALVYTAGLFTGPLSLANSIGWPIAVLGALFFLLALANLMILPWFERDMDVQQGIKSIATRRGGKVVENQARVALAISYVLILIVVMLTSEFDQAAIVFVGMSSALLALITWPRLFIKYQLYRIVGDGVFFLPALAILL